ncbi:hypothetical protein [Tunturiibacter gelidoferens]|jgi:hypothetical protein|uniref:Uncharacterized protein n=1 Tax=Tunturiibacter gelidiferens TaxID=3069689 RepID=A0A9X0QDV5_9BACT|nr:hypothetical protein [Edaphobacter lichenicola]MBB5328468.1 hypothetical protein [Edaphobacter lichenicola]
MALAVEKTGKMGLSLHGLGAVCGLSAGVWLGAAEAPTKLVNAGFSPFCDLVVHGCGSAGGTAWTINER